MSHLLIVECSFTVRRQAERWFNAIRAETWPYVWCNYDTGNRQWNVTALVERDQLPEVISNTDTDGYTVRSCH